MYKLVAIDLDGTLLNSYGEVSEENRNTIRKFSEKGAYIVLASGRTISSVKNLAVELEADKYIISGNGAVVYDVQKDEIIYNRFLTKKQVLDIAEICEANSIFYNVYSEEEIITKSLNYNVLFYHKENAKKNEAKRTNINIVQDIKKYVEESNNDNYLKITVCEENKVVFNSIIRKIKQIEGLDILDTAYMSRKVIKNGTNDVPISYFYTEITNENVNKWSAIEFLIQRLGIQPEEVMAIGDNINDKEMVVNAGLGVIMRNSSPLMKIYSDVIVADNNSSGVAEAMNLFMTE